MSYDLTCRPIPRSLPPPVPWPPSTGPTEPGAVQPPLPWSPQPADAPGGVRDAAAGQPRIISYADSWVAAAPDGVSDPAIWTGRLAGALLEALQGRRPVGQLNRWLDAPVLARLAWTARRPLGPAVLGTVHLHRIGPRTVEAVAVSREPGPPGAMVGTMAFRLQVSGQRWLCTALELLPPLTRPARPGVRGRAG